MATSPFQKTAIPRKTSDLDRLAKQFQQQVTALTGEQERAFAEYQRGVSEKMAPYESALKTYQETAFPAYQSQVAAYEERLKNYEAQLAEIRANPTVKAIGTFEEKVPRLGGLFGGLLGYDTKTRTYEYDEPRALPTFTESAPAAPEAPARPEIGSFSTEPFQARRASLESELKRELGERRSARMAAVSRRGRTMLSGA